ncbi:hypothetical protein L1887_34969 [Cichorium endivia]|nr:hypothetical protein L1887_34969 [Cichorium endivia]
MVVTGRLRLELIGASTASDDVCLPRTLALFAVVGTGGHQFDTGASVSSLSVVCGYYSKSIFYGCHYVNVRSDPPCQSVTGSTTNQMKGYGAEEQSVRTRRPSR